MSRPTAIGWCGVGEELSAGHLVVAVDQIVVEGGLGGGGHGAGLGETSVALQVSVYLVVRRRSP